MTVSRRKVLLLIGGGTVLAAAGGSAAAVAGRQVSTALESWSLAGAYGELRRDALSWALLAPNPHNLQPWQAALVGDHGVDLYLDPSRRLPETDPYDRQLTIGLGCFVELMRLAAAEAGAAVELEIADDGSDPNAPLVRATFRPDAAVPDPLFAAAANRRSCKEPFEDRAVPEEAVAILSEYGTVLTDPADVAFLRALTAEAWDVEMNTPAAWKESIDLLRIGAREVDASPDGIDLQGPFFNLGGALGFVTREGTLPTDSMGARQTRAMYREIMESTPAYVVQIAAGDSRRDRLDAGARWLRLNLAATGLGLALHPVSQALQEYPEMAGPYRRIHERYAEAGGTIQMLGRLGYGPSVPQTPRWRLEEKLIG